MTDTRDEFIPYWLQTAAPSGGNGGLLDSLTRPAAEPRNDPRSTIFAQTPWGSMMPPPPVVPPSAFPLAPSPSSWASSSASLWHTPFGANTGFPASPAQPAAEPWNDPRSTIFAQTPWGSMMPPPPFVPPSAFPPALPHSALKTRVNALLEHLDSGKYWPAAPAPSGANPQPPAHHGFYFSPVPQAPNWDSVPTDASVASLAQISSQPSSRSSWSTAADNPDGGQATNRVGTPVDPLILSDVTPDNEWLPGAHYVGVGHHHNPRAVYGKFALPPETRKVFDKATTGPLPFYGWHQFDELHRLYNRAIEDLMNRFMQEHNIKAQQMSPDHARAVLKAIAESEDPRIRVYRSMLQHMGRLFRLRSSARGSE